MAKKTGPKKETKSDFLRNALGKNPNLDHHQINLRWVKSGHAGTISSALYYHVRAELGIKTEWTWVQSSEPESTGLEPPGTVEVGRAKSATSRSAKAPTEVYQVRVSLVDSQPTIWRRIQVADCTLDTLHELIQTAMGWTNSHLHHFEINDKLYGDPMLLRETFEDLNYANSTTTMLSEIVPQNGRPFRFTYEYDFGDSWEHAVLFEGRLPAEPGQRYPVCLEGARACPPEDVGGLWGYAEFLEAIADPDHAEHKEMLIWVGGHFDPEAFDPALATKRMKKGLPNWRELR
ncbi:pRiA4b ORF-3-like protein [Singulisphaera sp. GP187]|uniref:plasmid pRiA4b ORF-3 family protein n=1 Tax=Singulisphaera sp. GP187 TaxID=1882752 RepID=UPI0009266C76|nr:plasmid pRiA4b ORF-3 family protein [Singulisphaera sp. GP187]SIN68284.1 pRiA4b ORF-3-like protein [Singulisphaera sp. GP187]